MQGTIAWAVRESNPLAALWPGAPSPGTGVCCVCRGCASPGYDVCYPCALTMSQVSRPCRRVAVMSVYRSGAALHRVLRDYKDGPTARVRSVLEDRVAALAGRFLWERGAGLAPEGWDTVAVVPSTAGRTGPHPLEAALARSAWLAPQLSSDLLVPGPGAVVCAHRRAVDDAFAVSGGPARVVGLRVLLVDDTWTTGARAQSAASVLARAGAEVVGLAVLGRIVTPQRGAPTGRWWAEHCGADRPEPGGHERRAVRRTGTAPRS